MLVEDNPDDQALMLCALKRNNIPGEVIIAHDGVEALNYLFNENLSPELILLDLKIPKIDGCEVLRRIRANRCTEFIPVVVLTTSREEKDMIECYRAGVNSYICKPIGFSEFSQVMQQLGSYWLVYNEIPSKVRADTNNPPC